MIPESNPADEVQPTKAEWDIIERAARFIGSDYRTLGVVQAALERAEKIRAECEIYKSALERIAEWDCINPEPVEGLYYSTDLPWLKRLIADALRGVKNW